MTTNIVHDTRTPTEIEYDRTRLSPAPTDDAEYEALLRGVVTDIAATLRDAEPADEPLSAEEAQVVHYLATRANTAQMVDQALATSVTADTYISDDGKHYTDLMAGEGLTRVRLGSYDGEKPGVDLGIGGCGINERIDEIITLDDVRQLRDNLTALLDDPRLGLLATPPAVRVEHLYHNPDMDGDYTNEPGGELAYVSCLCGTGKDEVEVSFSMSGEPTDVSLFGQTLVSLDQVERTIDNLQRLLADPRVQAARKDYEARQARRKAA